MVICDKPARSEMYGYFPAHAIIRYSILFASHSSSSLSVRLMIAPFSSILPFIYQLTPEVIQKTTEQERQNYG